MPRLLISVTLIVVGLIAGAAMAGTGSSRANAVGTGYMLFSDRWYQQVSDSGSYATWMTLSTDVFHLCSGCSGAWSTVIPAAVSSWNSTPTTVLFAQTSYDPDHDVHIIPYDDGSQFGYYDFGRSLVFDESYTYCGDDHDCPASGSRPNTWWYQHANVNHLAGWTDPAIWNGGTAAMHRQTVLAHELGHGLSLQHYLIYNGVCNASLMDYDCALSPAGSTALTPAPGDYCGVNNAYYDPNWGYSGC